MEQYDPADGDQGADGFSPLKRGFFHPEPSKQFNGISHDDLCHDNKERCFGRAKAVHALDYRVSDEGS